MRALMIVAAITLTGCEPAELGGSVATLYRNSPLDRDMRVHFASFDAPESGDFNLNNCEMVARVLNANVDASAEAQGLERDSAVGFWCESGGFAEQGAVPASFESEYPSDVRSGLKW